MVLTTSGLVQPPDNCAITDTVAFALAHASSLHEEMVFSKQHDSALTSSKSRTELDQQSGLSVTQNKVTTVVRLTSSCIFLLYIHFPHGVGDALNLT